jgi:phosphate starvation-inducible PhoH-like protein
LKSGRRFQKHRRNQRQDDEGQQDGNDGSRWHDRQESRKPKSIVVSAMTPGQKRYIVEVQNNDITFCYGPAGTGKTAVAVGLALQAVCAEHPIYEKLVVMRSVKEACGEEIGHLPGDLASKMGPWMAPIMDNVQVFCDQRQIKDLLWNKKIEVIHTGFARGRSLNGVFLIIDECQNLNKDQCLMILTRLGKGSKLVLTGDIAQSDIKGKNGLMDAIGRLQGIPGIGFVEMTSADIVRHPLIAEIIKRYTEPPVPQKGQ